VATPRLDDALIEFSFTPLEKVTARSLTPLQIQWFQTKYAELFKQRGSTKLPTGTQLDADFIKEVCELDGKLAMLEEIFSDHKAAMNELNTSKLAQVDMTTQTTQGVDTIQERASSLVHQQS
jgi:hypothetical protein